MADLKKVEDLTAGEHFEMLRRGPAQNPNPNHGRIPRVGEPAPDPTRDELREAGFVRRPKRVAPDRSKDPQTVEQHAGAIRGDRDADALARERGELVRELNHARGRAEYYKSVGHSHAAKVEQRAEQLQARLAKLDEA